MSDDQYIPAELPEMVASSFGLGAPISDLVPIQVGVHESWRLDTLRGSFMVKRLWRGQDPSWRSEFETSMELERRALEAGLPIAVPVEPLRAHFGWASRIAQHGVWRVYEWVDHTTSSTQVDARWFGRTLAELHRLFPLRDRFEPEWRWLGVYPPAQWLRWLNEARHSGQPWAPTVQTHLGDIEVITNTIRVLYTEAPDHIVSHRDFGPWNVLHTPDQPILIDWENAGPTTAWAELGRAIAAFGSDSVARMKNLIQAYREAAGIAEGEPQHLFNWHLTQHLSQITERIKIAVGDLDDEDDPNPIWMDAATINEDIANAVTALPSKADELAATASKVVAQG
ncbi:MAG TPA: aminoglycoside phosphotransferase family protein [Microlunatus sp.]